jgi:hypothetical protein
MKNRLYLLFVGFIGCNLPDSASSVAPAPSMTNSSASPAASSNSDPTASGLKRQFQGEELDVAKKLLEQHRAREYDGYREVNDFSVAGVERRDVSRFLDELKRAVAEGDRRKVAELVKYPTTVTLDGRGKPVVITSADEFMLKYDEIMNARVTAAVLVAEVENLFANWQGVAIGRGEIWFNAICETGERLCKEYVMRITKINNRPLPGTAR